MTKVGSGLQKVTDTSYLYDDTVAGQENYNHAANIGDVRTLLSDAQDVFVGNNGTSAPWPWAKRQPLKARMWP